MSVRIIHLRKLLKILYSEPNRRIASIRSDIREDIARDAGIIGGGGDFYGPFWKDAKEHVFGNDDLTQATRARVETNSGRANLYPRLRDGFLVWWNERRRWTNEPFIPSESIKARYSLHEFNAMIKIDNVLSVRDGQGEDHFIYPYFSPEPPLSDEAARVGLWLLSSALPNIDPRCLRVLDVIRGRNLSNERNPPQGNEQDIFRARYEGLINQWDLIRSEY